MPVAGVFPGSEAERATAPAGPDRRAYWALGLLTVVYGCNYIDRQLLSILLPPIKAELRLSDGELGVLTGAAFAIFYAAMGIPVAAWADRHGRRGVLTAAITLWSGFTMLCGAAQGFFQLALCRMGVGIGEGGGSPAAMAMISDLFTARRRATALSIYQLAIPISGVVGFAVGARIQAAYGWRAAFVIVGLPGLLLALLVWTTLREPAAATPPRKAAEPPESDWRGTLGFLWSQRSYRWLAVGVAINGFVGSGVLVWMTSFFVRSFGVSLVDVSTALAFIVGPFGAIGTLLGGWLGDRLGRESPESPMRMIALGLTIAVPASVTMFLAPSLSVAYGALSIWLVFGSLWFGPAFAMGQSLARPQMRATSAAVLGLLTNLIGYGGGPVAIGLLSDILTARLGPRGLGYALATTMLLNLATAVAFLLAARTIRADLARANGRPDRNGT